MTAEFFAAFAFVFVSALPGRTTFLMILMASRGRAAAVLGGSAAAFLLQCAISVGLGSALALMPERAVKGGAGLLFLWFAYRFWKESSKVVRESGEAAKRGPFLGAFLMVFAAEWGDVSQLAIASYVAEYGNKLLVFTASLAALWLIAALATLLGSRLTRVVSPRALQRGAAAVFLVVGAYFCAEAVGFTR
jgi:putative Ca2+/H+ antiporter (TMEM165/GDT1 family)